MSDKPKITLRLPSGVDVQLEFIDLPESGQGGEIQADPSVELPVETDAEGNMRWNGCGCSKSIFA